MPAPTLADVFATLQGYIDAYLPGCDPVELLVRMRSGPAWRIPVPRQPSRPAAAVIGRNARHSSDYRSAHWFGEDYTFTATQAACVKVLWDAWESGTPDLAQETILERAGSETQRLRDLFRDHPAWGVLIVPGPNKGAYQLAPG